MPTGGVTIRGLTKAYGRTTAVAGVDLDAPPARITGLLGRNGAGKTTTLECLLGLRTPDAGSIHVAGVDARADPTAAKRLVGAQLQATALQDKLTPREAVRFFASFYPAAVKPDALLERFDLTPVAARPVGTLSRGQQQRLALALAFVGDPPVLVLDEPTAGLDPHARRQLHDAIAGLRADGRTVLMSTHDIAEAERLCDHVVVIDAGRAVAAGTPAELVAAGGSSPTVVVRTVPPLPEPAVASVAVSRAELVGDAWHLTTGDVAHCLETVAASARRGGAELVDVSVRRPSLEEAFLRLTRPAVWHRVPNTPV